MNDDELKKYLARLLPDKNEADIKSEELQIVQKLIKLTLQYRDQLVAQKNSLNVQETRVAIELYWLALKKGHMPSGVDPKIEALIRLWLKEINRLTY